MLCSALCCAALLYAVCCAVRCAVLCCAVLCVLCPACPHNAVPPSVLEAVQRTEETAITPHFLLAAWLDAHFANLLMMTSF